MRGNAKSSLLADAHSNQTLIPSLNDLAHAKSKRKRRVAIQRRVKLGSVRQKRSSVVHGKLVALGSLSGRLTSLRTELDADAKLILLLSANNSHQKGQNSNKYSSH